MKTSNAKKIALYAALISSIIAGAAMFLLFISDMKGFIPVIVVSLLLVFAAVYLLVYSVLNNFIVKNINPIYKTINNLQASEKKLKKKLNKMEPIEDLNREVVDWASGKTREIDQLKEMESYRREFLGNVAHEMKTPIFNVQGYLQTLMNGEIDDPSINKLYLERAEKSINRLINILDDLDVIYRLDSGEVKIKFDNFDVVQLTKEIFDLQKMNARKHGVALLLKKNQDEPIMVHADRKRIQEVLINLVVNSIKYGNKDGCTSVDFIDLEDKILVEVSDNGLGIPNEDLSRIFERFYRVDKTRSRNEGGTGLGLAIVKHIIEAHNQNINVRSKEGQGTIFTFTLMKGR